MTQQSFNNRFKNSKIDFGDNDFSSGLFSYVQQFGQSHIVHRKDRPSDALARVRGESNANLFTESLKTANRLRSLGFNAAKCISEADDILILLISAVESFVNKETPSDEDLEQAKAVIDSYRLGE